jgi:hypothetical protein
VNVFVFEENIKKWCINKLYGKKVKKIASNVKRLLKIGVFGTDKSILLAISLWSSSLDGLNVMVML